MGDLELYQYCLISRLATSQPLLNPLLKGQGRIIGLLESLPVQIHLTTLTVIENETLYDFTFFVCLFDAYVQGYHV